MATPTGNASKRTILDHMNADHQDFLSLSLQVYNRVSAQDAQSARLEDITLSDLLITAQGTRYTVPLDPPMKSMSEARTRVMAMHQNCLSKLGLSDVVVTEYRPPRGFHAVVFGLCLCTYALYSRRAHFVPGSWVYDNLLARMPRFAEICYKIQPALIWGMLAIHGGEAVLLMFRRLKPHRVPVFSRLWFTWVGSNLIEGVGAWQRFDRMVKEKRAKSA